MYIYSIAKKCFPQSLIFFLLVLLSKPAFSQCSGINFTAIYNKGCLPTLVKFVASGAPKGSFYYWNFGKGTVISGGDTVLESYTTAGTYTISLDVRLPNGTLCKITKNNYLVFNNVSTPKFSTPYTTVCSSPTAVTFTDSTLNVVKREWYIDGVLLTKDSSTITHVFNSTGYHSVALKVYDANGCSKILAKNNYIYVPEKIKIDFCSKLVEDSTHKKITATFRPYIDPNAKDIVEYNWSFPGGTPSSYKGLNPPVVTYNDLSKSYDVSFSIKTKNGCVSEFKKSAHIKKILYPEQGRLCMTTSPSIKVDIDTLIQPLNLYFSKNVQLYTNGLKNNFRAVFRNDGVIDFYAVFTWPGASCTDTMIVKKAFDILPPSAAIDIDNARGCNPPEKVILKPQYPKPSYGVNTYTWEIIDTLGKHINGSPIGPTTKGDTFIVINNFGLYSVKLTVVNSVGCSTSVVYKNIIRILSVNSKVQVLNNLICPNQKVIVENNVSPAEDPVFPYIHFWILRHKDSTGLAYTSKVIKPVFYPQMPGFYNLTYTISNRLQCPQTQYFPNAVTVNGIIATVSAGSYIGCAPFVTTLKSNIKLNLPTNSALTYSWEIFPSGGVTITNPNSANTTITVAKSGIYSVKLTIKNAYGCSTIIQKDSLIKIGTVADFEMPSGACLGNEIIPVNKSLFEPDFYKWSVSPFAGAYLSSDTAKDPILKFNAEGCYTVTLITGKELNPLCSDTLSKTICISKPDASFYSPDSAKRCAPVIATFVSTSKTAAKYLWDFGDGSSLLTEDTSTIHTYTQNNIFGYNVKLTAFNEFGCADSITMPNYIKVYGPVPSFAVDNQRSCEKALVNFINTSTNVFKYYMSYGDNSAIDSNTIKPHFYSFQDYNLDSNVYYPTIYALDDSSCLSDFRLPIILYRPAKASFTTADTVGCAPYIASFKNASLYSSKYEWDFDMDGIIDDTTENPVHIFEAPGTYRVTLVAITKNGCRDTFTWNNLITVNPKPVAGFVVSPVKACYLDTVYFSSIVQSNVPIVKYFWDFGDAGSITDTSNQLNPRYHYTTPGQHDVTLYIENQNGCRDTFTLQNAVFVDDTIPPVTAEIYYATVTPQNHIRVYYATADSSEFYRYHIYRDGNIVYNTSNFTDTAYMDTKAVVNVNQKSYSYYVEVEDKCGYRSQSVAHSTVHLKATPNSPISNKLQWTPYIGWSNVSAYEIYKSKNGDNYNLLATVPGTQTMYIDTPLCDDFFRYYIKAIHPNGKFSSFSNRDSLRTAYVYQNVPLEIYYTTVLNNSQVYTVWEPGKQVNINKYIIDRYTDERGWQLNFHRTANNYFLDTDVDVNKTSYTYRIKVVDNCGNVSPYSNYGRSILLNSYIKDDKRHLTWNTYKDWNEGVLEYKVQLLDDSRNFVTIAHKNALDTLYVDDSVHTEIDTATCYRVVAVESSFGNLQDSSLSNVRCAVLPSRVFIPSAFTPNGNNINEVFIPLSLSLFNRVLTEDLQYNFRVFNRWGELVFETHDVHKGWDGRFEGDFCKPDVYVYVVEAHGFDGKHIFQQGTVTIIR